MAILFFFLLLILLLIVYVLHCLYFYVRFRLPPGPHPLPVIGNLYNIKPIRFRCYKEWADRYGPIISVWFGSTLMVVVSDPKLAKQVLKEKDRELANRHRSRSAAKFSRDGKDLVWADYGPHYVKVRKLCTIELFSSKRIEALRAIREHEVAALVASLYKLTPGARLQLRKYIGATSFNNITRLTFGKRLVNDDGTINKQGQELKAILANGLRLGGSLEIAEHIPWLRWMFPLDENAFAKHGARRDRLTREIMDECEVAHGTLGDHEQHFLGALLKLKDRYGLSEDNVIGLLWDMITAGVDTTSISVEWAMAELIKNPSVQQKAQHELDRVIGHDHVMTELDFPNLTYLQCVVKEALRLHPPTPLLIPHRANANVNIGGYYIPKGSNVHVNVWAIGRNSQVWNNPLEFRPERFLEENISMKGQDFRLLPFGSGRRMCPGAQLGINLAMSMIGHLIHNFNWSPPEGVTVEEIDMWENPGIAAYMRTPLEVMATPRFTRDMTTN